MKTTTKTMYDAAASFCDELADAHDARAARAADWYAPYEEVYGRSVVERLRSVLPRWKRCTLVHREGAPGELVLFFDTREEDLAPMYRFTDGRGFRIYPLPTPPAGVTMRYEYSQWDGGRVRVRTVLTGAGG